MWGPGDISYLLGVVGEGGREDFEEVGGALNEGGAGAGRGRAPLAGPPGSVEPEGGFVEEAEEVGEVDGERGAGRGYMDGGGHCCGGSPPDTRDIKEGRVTPGLGGWGILGKSTPPLRID